MRLSTLKFKGKLKKIQLNSIQNTILVLLFSIAITFLCFALQPNSISEVFDSIRKSFLVFVFNFLPVLICMTFLFFVTNNVFYSATAVSILFGAASLANKYKIIYRDDPFVPIDVSVGIEAISIIAKTNLKIDVLLVIMAILPVLALIAAGFLIKSRKINLVIRISAILLCIISAFLMNNFIYKSSKIYNKLPVKGSLYHVTANFNSKGFIYCFLYNMNSYKIDVPENYSKQYAEEIRSKYAADKKKIPDKKPHVIMIMNEAFSDISINNNLVFSSEEDPLKNFKRISEEGLGGHIVVPNYGGGTANTEYDVLTSCMTVNLSETNMSAFRVVRKDISSLPRFFAGNGYDTLFIHPGDAWFYNRSNVYKFFGIEKQIFIDKFQKPQDLKGSLISDKAAIDKIIKEFGDYVNSRKDKPLFNFTVTIQNHMPYTKGKYGNINIPPVNTKVQLSAKASELLSNYMVGLRDSDRELGRLVEYLKQSDEPVVLVFFGDHLPSLGENYLTYNEIGYSINESGSYEEMMNSFKVPFIIWANDKAKNTIGFDNAVKGLGLPQDKTINASYLGPVLYQILGYQGAEPFYDFLNGLRKSVPVFRRDIYRFDSAYVTEIPEEVKEKLYNYKIWQYYKMRNVDVK